MSFVDSEQNEPLNPDPQIPNNADEKSTKRSIQEWEHTVKVAAPHVAILFVVLVYILVGAVIFHKLEYSKELYVKRIGLENVERAKRHFEITMWNLSAPSSIVLEYEWQMSFQKALANFSETVFLAMKNNYLEHSELFGGARRDLWSYEGAVLFAFAVITTIGYGNIVPATTNGRVFCIFYALLGIPLSMLAIANIGKFLAEAMTYVMEYRRSMWIRLGERVRESDLLMKIGQPRVISALFSSTETLADDGDGDRDRPTPIAWLLLIAVLYLCTAAAVLPLWEKLDFFTAFYFSFITITTTGLGDIVPESYTYLPLTLMFLGLGIAIITMCVELVSNAMRKLHYSGRPVTGTRFAKVQFGGKTMTVAELMDAVGKRYGISQEEMNNFLNSDFDNFIAQTIDRKDKQQEDQPDSDIHPRIRSQGVQTENISSSPVSSVQSSSTSTNPSPERERFSFFHLSPSVLLNLLRPLQRFNPFHSFSISDESIPYIDEDKVYTSV